MQGSEMKALRKGVQMTQAEFAQALGISGPYVGELERGEKEIDKRTALAARYVGAGFSPPDQPEATLGPRVCPTCGGTGRAPD